jgi:hypothetical protein
MAIFKRGRVYWYDFTFRSERIQQSTRQGNQNVARQMGSGAPDCAREGRGRNCKEGNRSDSGTIL